MSQSSLETSATLLGRLIDRQDQAAWQRLVTIYSPLLRQSFGAAGLQPADVDDLTQRALEILFRSLERFRSTGTSGSFRAWLRGIANNLLREHRRQRRPSAAELAEIPDSEAALSDWLNCQHDSHVLRGLLDAIESEFTPATWQAFRRQVLDEQPASRVALDLNLSVNAVLIAKSRVLSRLRREARGLIES